MFNDTDKIFLDLDGPLLDGKERHYHCYRSILEKFGFEPIEIESYWRKKRALLNRMDLLKMSGAETLYNVFFVAWMSMIESPEVLALDKVQEGAFDCLHSWKDLGIEITLVTMRKDRQALERQLESTGLRPLLDAVLVSDHKYGGVGKADAVLKFFHGAVNKDHALWIGDTEADLEASSSLGCRVVLLSNGLRDEEYLKSLQGAVVEPSIISLKNLVLRRGNVSQ